MRENPALILGSRLVAGLRLTARDIAAFRPLDTFLAERSRWFLWLPVLLGAGIGIHFALPYDPPLWPLRAGLVAGIALCLLLRRRAGLLIALIPLFVMLTGLWLAAERSLSVAAPALERRMPAAWLEGRVLLVEPRDKGHRLTLEELSIERLDAAATPRRVRVTLTQGAEDIWPGQRLRLRAVLGPPSPPAMPGAFDFARSAWFQRLGGIGFALGLPEILPDNDELGFADRARQVLAGWQQSLTQRIYAGLAGMPGAIAAALMTGVRGPIPADVDDAFRDSGLAHILSISGLHLALVAGILYAGLRGLLALSPYLALHWPIKKIAAFAALIGAFAYMLLSGSALATQRSFVMVAFALIAVLLDRRAISFRSLAWAALALLIAAPESLLDAGLQMSFGAVAALLAAYEILEPRLAAWRAAEGTLPGWARLALLWFLGAIATSFVAGLGSGLIAAYHFNRFADYSVAANMIASPLVTFWIMPLAMLAFALMPFGLEDLALAPMGWGIEGLVWIARWVAAWPGAIEGIPAMPGWALPAILLGGLWLCLWRRGWRWLGIVPLGCAMVSVWIAPLPDILIGADGRLLALKSEGGRYYFSRAPKGFEGETWWRRLGAPDLMPWPNPRRGRNAPPEMSGADGRLRCDATGCTARLSGPGDANWLVALPRAETDLAESCRTADIVIAAFPLRGRCKGARVVIDRFDTWRRGAQAIYLKDYPAMRIDTVEAARGRRAWAPQKGHAARQAPPPGDESSLEP